MSNEVSKLTKGLVTKLDEYIGSEVTYKKITDIIGIQYYKSGNAKTKQLDVIQQYYKLEKNKTKYKIVERYKNPLKNIDNRKSKYYDDLSTLILYALHNNSKYACWSVGKALCLTTLTNDNYNVGKNDLCTTSKVLEVDRCYLYDFYNTTYNRLKRIFESALNRMQSSKLLQYNIVLMTCKKDIHIMLNKLGEPQIDSNGKIQYNVNEVFAEATKEERELILNAENAALKECDCKSIQQVILSRKYEYYKSIVNRIIRREANIEYYYKAYDIVKYNKGIAGEIEEIEKYYSSARLNKLKVDSFINSKSKQLNRIEEDKEVLIQYLIDNTCNSKLSSMINNFKDSSITKSDTDIPF